MIKTVEAGFKCLRKHIPNEYIIVEKKIDGGKYVKGSSPVTTWTTYCHGYDFHRERTFEEALNGLLTDRQTKGGNHETADQAG
ncbi:MAG: hypothetical protein Q8M94_21550 [Ignavibacteria bacterium]|nr:hypothetical protein [Ignavibacteria bacterium]